jgi:hypothetical protein
MYVVRGYQSFHVRSKTANTTIYSKRHIQVTLTLPLLRSPLPYLKRQRFNMQVTAENANADLPLYRFCIKLLIGSKYGFE